LPNFSLINNKIYFILISLINKIYFTLKIKFMVIMLLIKEHVKMKLEKKRLPKKFNENNGNNVKQ